jgi:hypothetical protein
MTQEIPYCHCCGNRHADIGVLCEPCHDYTARLRALVRSAWDEAWLAGNAGRCWNPMPVWDKSETKKELERQQ